MVEPGGPAVRGRQPGSQGSARSDPRQLQRHRQQAQPAVPQRLDRAGRGRDPDRADRLVAKLGVPGARWTPTCRSTSWWSKFPAVVQSEGTFGGKVYAVDQGENDSALLYNKTMFRKAGLPVPWTPHNWQDIVVGGGQDQGLGSGRDPAVVRRRIGLGRQRPAAGHQQLHRRVLDAQDPGRSRRQQVGGRQPGHPRLAGAAQAGHRRRL